MIAFWIAAAGLSAVVAGLVLREAAQAGQGGGDDASLAVHRRQLAEIDDLAERGLLAGAELKTARAEAGRRLLAAADGQHAWPAAGPRARPLILAITGLAPVLALSLYVFVGMPGMVDQPFLKRVAAWREGDPSRLTAEEAAAALQQAVAEHPGDAEPLRLLAMARLASGDATGAAQALRKAVTLAPQRADLWSALGQVFVVEAEGEVGTDARKAFAKALARDPNDAVARYSLARARIADGDLAGGLADWRALLAILPTDDPRRAAFGEEIAKVQAQGGLEPKMVAATGQPEAGQPAEVQAMIQGMVSGLAARLESQPDDSDGWVKLVRAYSVLGDTARRDEALAKAQARFKDQPKVMAALRQAAQTPAQNVKP